MDERSCYLFLNLLSLGYRTALKLRNQFGSLSAAVAASRHELEAVPGIRKKSVAAIVEQRETGIVAKENALAAKTGCKVITIDDDEYPSLLRETPTPPLVLYVLGEITEQDAYTMAIVGTRTPSSYGKSVAYKIGYDLARSGITVVSGLAKGLDSEAHRAALKSGGRTFGVLGSGLLRLYPKGNEKLAKQIRKQGAVISEFPLETEPFRSNFPIRNRVISGLSYGTIVVEAAAKSGSLITAGFATEQGRTVFAVPGNIDQPTSSGTNRLINQGAVLYESCDDLFREIPYLNGAQGQPVAPVANQIQKMPNLTPDEKKVVTLFAGQPLHIDELTEASDAPVPELSVLLLTLEMKQVLTKLPGNYYTLTQQPVTL